MSSDYKDKHYNLIQSFSFALKGIQHTFKYERNMKIHTAISFVVVLLGFLYRLSSLEWLFILFAIGGVLTLELINTAVERTVDLFSKDVHPLAKQAKDAAAAAVLVYAALSVIVGCIIFLPKII